MIFQLETVAILVFKAAADIQVLYLPTTYLRRSRAAFKIIGKLIATARAIASYRNLRNSIVVVVKCQCESIP